MRREIRDMVVVITGASAGIGRAAAEELGRRGARLVLSARRLDRLDEINAKLGGGHLCVVADVSKQEDCARLIEEAVKKFGRLDTLVCNAGYGVYDYVAKTPPEQVRAMFATNVFGTTDCVHAAAAVMEKQEKREGWRGQIMIVSSCVARRGVPVIGVYSGTKAAQLAMAEAMRVELRGKRIAVTTVHPVTTTTEFGRVAETQGPIRLPGGIPRGPAVQTAEHVARRMVKAMARPRPEVWPLRPSRWVFGLAGLMPRLFDAGMKVYLRKVEQFNDDKAKG